MTSVTAAPPSYLLRQARLLPVGQSQAEPVGVVDLRISGAAVTAVAPALAPKQGDEVLDLWGRWVAPGLWDQHVHMTQWGLMSQRLDLAPATSAAHAARIVADHITQLPRNQAGTVLQGWGHRSATWAAIPQTSALDAVSGEHPVVLISGDGHHAWMNSLAMRHLGLPHHDGIVVEREWFDAFPRLVDLPGSENLAAAGLSRAAQAAAACGTVGIVDLEFGQPYRDWPARVMTGLTSLRVRAGVYPAGLDEAIQAGVRTGDVLDGHGLITMGPLKIISDGSLNTRTAHCVSPYADAAELDHPRGVQNYPVPEMIELVSLAKASGLDVAVHAIGDAAVKNALTVLAATGARGSIEHAQLIDPADIPRLAALGLTASVQPAHLLDDHEVMRQFWPDRTAHTFPLKSMLAARVRLAMGSDAPVSPLDPWLAMWAAVRRQPEGGQPWYPAQSLTRAQALAASTDGHGTVGVGSPADLVVLDQDPLDEQTDLRAMTGCVAATFVGGRPVHVAP